MFLIMEQTDIESSTILPSFFRKNHYKVQRKAPMEQRRVMPMKAQKITVYWSILPCYETKSSEHKLKILKNFQMLKMTE